MHFMNMEELKKNLENQPPAPKTHEEYAKMTASVVEETKKMMEAMNASSDPGENVMGRFIQPIIPLLEDYSVFISLTHDKDVEMKKKLDGAITLMKTTVAAARGLGVSLAALMTIVNDPNAFRIIFNSFMREFADGVKGIEGISLKMASSDSDEVEDLTPRGK